MCDTELMYSASISFLYWDDKDNETYEKKSIIRFLANSKDDALEQVFKWIANRQKELPDCFGECCCVKISPFYVSRIGDEGHLQPTRSFTFYEWKYDLGRPPPFPINLDYLQRQRAIR